jgi:lipoate-protein ligase A
MGQGRTPRRNGIGWRVLITPAAGGAENMGLDEALLERARASGECVMRVYEWHRPTLSLGRNQTARGRYDTERARVIGVDFVRRPTGGRAVLHHRELTYSVTAPAAALGTLRESYSRINEVLVAALRRLGVRTSVTGRGARAAQPGVAPCFDAPAAGELVVGGRKLVGSAQWRDGGALLQHGSILVDGDQALASELLRTPSPRPPQPATLRGVLGREPTGAELADALRDAIVTLEGVEASPMAVDDALRSATWRARARYLDDRWTWRR